MSVSLRFDPDPGGQQLEAVATEPAAAIRSDAGSEWATVLEGRGWGAVWVPPRPVAGRVSLVGRLVVDRGVMVGPTVRGRVLAVDSLPGEDFCRVSLEVDPLRPRFVPGSMTWSQEKLWVVGTGPFPGGIHRRFGHGGSRWFCGSVTIGVAGVPQA